MLTVLHRLAAILALALIFTFWLSTVLVELFGDPAAIALVKQWIVLPGLALLIPALALTGASGAMLARRHQGESVRVKQRRMPLIAANGLLILVPAALFLDGRAAAGQFDSWFYAVQLLELLAGATNLALMLLNLRDGRRLVRAAAAES